VLRHFLELDRAGDLAAWKLAAHVGLGLGARSRVNDQVHAEMASALALELNLDLEELHAPAWYSSLQARQCRKLPYRRECDADTVS